MYRPNHHYKPTIPPPKGTAQSKQPPLMKWISQKGLWMVGILIFVAAVFWVLKPVLAILAASIGIAYILEPSINWFEKRGLSRERAVGAAFLLVIAATSALSLIIIPPIIIQFEPLSQALITRLQGLEGTLSPIIQQAEGLLGRKIPVDFAHIKLVAIDFVQTHAPQVQAYIKSLGQVLLTQGLGLVSTILNVVLLPIFVFYICRDRKELVDGLYKLIPHRYHDVVQETAAEVDQRLSAFIKAQLTVCLYLAILYTIGLLIVGIKLALPIGVLSGILFLIPYIGTAIGLFSSLLVCLINFGISWQLLGVVIVYIVVHNIESFLLVPYIVGDKVGLSPMVVMLALIVGGSLMGIWGMVLAIPITAILSVISTRWIEQYRLSDFYMR